MKYNAIVESGIKIVERVPIPPELIPKDAQDSDTVTLYFHIVAVGKDFMGAQILKQAIEKSIQSCLPYVHREVVPFFLPETSGLFAQLSTLKLKSSHWNSHCGADMVRFYMAQIFSHVPRLLYLDNDIIVSCCIEEIWGSKFDSSVAVGVVLDDLKWATATQWQRHYNASHPLQFTVLTLFDRWVEITPRANLRHFPDMARGYMLWFSKFSC
eukprot:gene27309-36053_t